MSYITLTKFIDLILWIKNMNVWFIEFEFWNFVQITDKFPLNLLKI